MEEEDDRNSARGEIKIRLFIFSAKCFVEKQLLNTHTCTCITHDRAMSRTIWI